MILLLIKLSVTPCFSPYLFIFPFKSVFNYSLNPPKLCQTACVNKWQWAVTISLFLCLCLCPDKRQWRRLDAGLHVEPDQHDSGRGSRLSPTTPRRLRLHSHHHGGAALHPFHRQPASSLAPLLQTATDRINTRTDVQHEWRRREEGLYVSVMVYAALLICEQHFSSLCGEVKG